MAAIRNPFKSIEEIKEKCEHIRKGQIYPARILRSTKKDGQHLLTAGSNQWAVNTPKGYLLFVENNDGCFESVIKIKKGNYNFNVVSDPYGIGKSWFQGNISGNNDALECFNRRYAGEEE